MVEGDSKRAAGDEGTEARGGASESEPAAAAAAAAAALLPVADPDLLCSDAFCANKSVILRASSALNCALSECMRSEGLVVGGGGEVEGEGAGDPTAEEGSGDSKCVGLNAGDEDSDRDGAPEGDPTRGNTNAEGSTPL